MVQYQPNVFAALADPVRLDIVARLAAGAAPVAEIAAAYPMTLQAVRKHLSVLEGAGVVKSEKRGRVRTCRLDPEPLEVAMAWLADRKALWSARLDALAVVVEGRET